MLPPSPSPSLLKPQPQVLIAYSSTIGSGRAYTFRDSKFKMIHTTCYDIPQEISSFFKVRTTRRFLLHYVKGLLKL